MAKKFILFLIFMFLGNFIPCLAMNHTYYSEGPLPEPEDIKNNDTNLSSKIKKPRSKKKGRIKYPKSKKKSVVSKIGNWLKDTKDTIGETLAQVNEAISQTNNSISSSNQLPNNDVLNTQENNTQISESEMFNSLIAFPKIDKLLAGLTNEKKPIEDILVSDCQQEKICQIQQPVVHIEPVLDNKPIEQQEINIMPSGPTITPESTIQLPAELPQPSDPTLASEIYDGTIWFLKKVGRGTVRGIKKTSEWAEWARSTLGKAGDKVDEFRIGLEEKQKKEKKDLRRQKFIENCERVQAAQKALAISENYQDGSLFKPVENISYLKEQEFKMPEKLENKVNILNQDTKIEDKILPILPQQIDVKPEVFNDIGTQIDDIKKDQMQEVPNNVFDMQKQQNTEQKQEQEEWVEITEEWSQKPDEILSGNQEEINIDIQNKVELFKLFGISCDKKQLMYFGAGAVVLITICGVVVYVLYKDGTYKKVGKYIGEHKFAVSGAASAVCALVIVGIYAKQQGMTLQSAGTWITNLFGINRTESI